MADLIENPVINSPFGELQRHFQFDENGITHEILTGRWLSTYFISIAKLKGAQKQAALDLSVQHRAEENKLINDFWARGALAAGPPILHCGHDPALVDGLKPGRNVVGYE